jgi:hypothetical protein
MNQPQFESNVRETIERASVLLRDLPREEAHRRTMLQILNASGWRFGMNAKQTQQIMMGTAGCFADFILALGQELNTERNIT